MLQVKSLARFWIFSLVCLFAWQCGNDNPTTTVVPEIPELSLSHTSVTFDAGERQKSITLSNSGNGDLAWRAKVTPELAWLSITPDSGKAGDTMTITVNDLLLSPGTHGASIQFTSNGGDKVLPLTVLIAKISVANDAIGFESSENSKAMQIHNLGAGKLHWRITEVPELAWLNISSTSGEDTATVILTVDRSMVSIGSHSGSLILTSTGGNDSVKISMSKLPSSVFVDEFSAGLDNWSISNAIGTTENGFLQLTGTSSTRFGIARHSISPVRSAPWAYRAAFGRKNRESNALSSIVMQTDDSGTISISAFRFDLISGSSTRNWQAVGFLFNSSTLSGGWALLQEDSFSLSSRLQLAPDATNDVTWAMKANKDIEIFVDGAPFHASDILNQLSIGVITVGLESVEIWTTDDLTTIVDWALVRDVDQPGRQVFKTQSAERSKILEFARQIAFQQFKDGSWKNLPTLQEVYEQLR